MQLEASNWCNVSLPQYFYKLSVAAVHLLCHVHAALHRADASICNDILCWEQCATTALNLLHRLLHEQAVRCYNA